MAIPASYTEKTLAQYMETMLGKTAKVLALHAGPEDAGDFAEAVNDVLLAYGTNDIATISGIENLKKLRALAVVSAWQFVVNNFAALYDFSADGASYDRSQLFESASKALAQAELNGLPYLVNYQARVTKLDRVHDPYTVRPEDETGA